MSFIRSAALAVAVAFDFGLGFGAFPISASRAEPATRLDEILAKGVLRVGSTGDYKPFTFFDKAKGTFEGYDIDMANELGKALGVKVEFVQTSWPNLMKDFDAGQFDLAMGGISVTLERAKKAFFSSAYMREGKTPIARCTDKDKYNTVAEIDKPGVRVITNPGGTNEKFDRANFKAAEIRVHPDNTTIFDELVKGNADLMITDSSETRFQQKVHPELCAIHPDTPFDFAEKAYLLPRDVAFQAYVNAWMHIMVETGGSKRVYTNYFGN